MLKKVYAVKDRLNGFMNLFLEDNDDVAIRGFLAGVANQPKGSLFYLHPDDYSLYCLGVFDLKSGTLTPVNTPEFLVTARALDSGILNPVSNFENDLEVSENDSVD